MRDRRWDFLYEREIEPVKDYLISRFAQSLAEELSAWPPPDLDFTTELDRQRFSAGAAVHPRDDVIRLALSLARLDLAREFERLESYLEGERHRLKGPDEEAALHLLARLATEACLELKERVRVHLSRADLIAALDAVERRLFRVTLG